MTRTRFSDTLLAPSCEVFVLPYAVVDFFDPDDDQHLCVAGPFEPRPHQVAENQLIQEGVALAIESGQLSPEEARNARKILRFIERKV